MLIMPLTANTMRYGCRQMLRGGTTGNTFVRRPASRVGKENAATATLSDLANDCPCRMHPGVPQGRDYKPHDVSDSHQ